MLTFQISQGPLRTEHERLLRTVLRRGEGAERRPGEVVDLSAYDEATLTAARRVWSMRMVNEHHSAAVFANLLPQLMEAGAPLDYKTSIMRMAMDELHHGALCAEVVAALGGTPEALVDLKTAPLPTHPGCGPVERALRNALFVGCLAETVAVAFTTEEREQTREPYIKRVITQISADEVLHARFGWAYLQEVAPTLDDPARARTNLWLRVAFRYLEREEMLEVPSTTPPPEDIREQGLALGVCHNAATRQLFYETVHTAILPGLEAAGLNAVDAWRNRMAA